MQNLEQLRAAAALEFWRQNQNANQGQDGGNVVSKLPSLIINNGLLATLAFAKDKAGGHQALALAVVQFLARSEVGVIPQPAGFRQGEGPLDPFIGALTANDSIVLQRATSESLAFLAYLKRFAPGD